MNTDELRSNFKGRIHFNCKNGDEAFTDEYTMWLESQLLSENHEVLHNVSKRDCPRCDKKKLEQDKDMCIDCWQKYENI